MNLTLIIILCVAISLVLILSPLFISYKAEKEKKDSEWDKIAEYGNKINEQSRKNKLH